MGIVSDAVAIERIGANVAAVERSVRSRAGVHPVDDLLAIEGGTIGEPDGVDAFIGLVLLLIELDPVALRIGDEYIALSIPVEDQLRAGDPGPELQDRRRRLEGMVVVDLELAIAGVEQEGVLSAIALGVASRAVAIEGVGAGIAAVERFVGRRSGIDLVDDLLTVESRAIGEPDGGDALESLAELRIELDPVALPSVMMMLPVGSP